MRSPKEAIRKRNEFHTQHPPRTKRIKRGARVRKEKKNVEIQAPGMECGARYFVMRAGKGAKAAR